MSNARSFVRFDVKQDILVNDRVHAKALDISETGLFIHSHILFPVGSIITLDFSLQGATPPTHIRTKALVQHVKKGVGIGVRFQDISEEMLARIKFFVENFCRKSTECRQQVLIVEESAVVRTMFRTNIVLKGFDVREAADGHEALKQIAHSIPDLVLIDLYKDNMDSLQFLKAVRADEKLKDLKLVVLSSATGPDLMEQLAPYGILGFLAKMTTTPKNLAEHIASYLE